MKKFSVFVPALLASILILLSCEKKVVNKKPVIEITTNSITIKADQDSVFLTATASDEDGQIVSYLWRMVSGQGSPEILTPSEQSTWVRNLVQGYYVFQILVKDEAGDVTSDTIAVDVLEADTLTFSATPSNNINEVHLFGNTNGIDQTDTIAPELLGGSGSYLGDPVNIRALLKFDLNTIPDTATIISAKLTLYSNPTPLNGIDGNPNYGTDNALLIQRVLAPWVYNTVNWLNQPEGSSTGQIEIPHTAEPALDLVDIDVKDLVAEMHSGENNGFLIRLKTEAMYNFRIFCSSKYADATKHPKLEVVYAKQ
jgi:hypothetical protein